MKKTSKKLSLSRETVRQLDARELTQAIGGMLPETRYTYCGGYTCYKPNPY
jgi:hypothetical protein